jgi:peroxiredoxin
MKSGKLTRKLLVRIAVAALALFLTLGLLLYVFVARTVGTNRAPAMLDAGVRAPLFALPDQTGRIHRLLDYSSRPVILVFFNPQSHGFQSALQSLRVSMPEFDKTGAKVFAITHGTKASLVSFHDEGHLNYPILNDPDLKTAASYGAIDENGQLRDVSIVIDDTRRVVLSIPVSEAHASQFGFQLMNMAACCLNPAATPAITRAGGKIDPFTLPDALTGKQVALLPDDGTTVHGTVIEFLSARCPCALGYDKRIESLATRFQPKGIRFLAINSSVDETAENEQKHIRDAGLTFPVLMDKGNVVADQINARVTPEFFLLDAKQVIRYHGRLDDSRDPASVTQYDLDVAITALLARKPIPEGEGRSIGCAIMRAQNVTAK